MAVDPNYRRRYPLNGRSCAAVHFAATQRGDITWHAEQPVGRAAVPFGVTDGPRQRLGISIIATIDHQALDD